MELPDGEETILQAVRNLVLTFREQATHYRLLSLLTPRYPLAAANAALRELERARVISLDAAGFYRLGAPSAGEAPELTLVSSDPSFGQPSLF